MDWLIFCLVAGSFIGLVVGLVLLFDIDKAQAPFMALSTVTITLYCFGLVHLLKWGGYFVIVGAYVLLGGGLYKKRKAFTIKNAVKFLTNPPFIFIAFFSGLTILTCHASQKVFVNPDDVSHWALAFKLMRIENQLYGFYDVNVLSFSYPPGPELVWYYFMFGMKQTREWLVFSINNIAWYICLATGLTGILNIKRKRKGLQLTILSVLFVMGVSVFEDALPFTDSLFIEPLMAVIFTALLSTYFLSKNIRKQEISVLIVGSLFLGLTKDFGVLLTCCFWGIVCLDQLSKAVIDKKIMTSLVIKKILICACALLLPFSMWISWNFVLSKADTVSTVTRVVSNVASQREMLNSENLSIFIKKFVKAVFELDLGVFTPFSAIFILSLLLFLSYKYKISSKRSNVCSLIGGMIITFIIHLAVLAFIYIFIFRFDEGIALAQMERYLSPMLCGYLCFTVAYLGTKWCESDVKNLKTGDIISICLMTILGVLIIKDMKIEYTPFYFEYRSEKQLDDKRQTLQRGFELHQGILDENDKIFVLAQGDCRDGKTAMAKYSAQYEYYPYYVINNVDNSFQYPVGDWESVKESATIYQKEYFTTYLYPKDLLSYVIETGATKVLVVPSGNEIPAGFKKLFDDNLDELEKSDIPYLYEIIDGMEIPFERIG